MKNQLPVSNVIIKLQEMLNSHFNFQWLIGWNDDIRAYNDKVGYLSVETIEYDNDSLLCLGINKVEASLTVIKTGSREVGHTDDITLTESVVETLETSNVFKDLGLSYGVDHCMFKTDYSGRSVVTYSIIFLTIKY